MTLAWIHEPTASWDAHKGRVLGEAPEGVFDPSLRDAAVLPGSWWRVEQQGRVVAYGWMDVVWGDGEVLVAVSASARGQGIGTFVLAKLQEEAAARGLNYVLNVVPQAHPARAEVVAWLARRGFEPGRGVAMLVARVRARELVA